jgi:hypothetical protein
LVDSEDFPCSEAELQLLADIRAVRNDAAHGRPANPPRTEELDYATAIVCRLVMCRLAKPPRREPGTEPTRHERLS